MKRAGFAWLGAGFGLSVWWEKYQGQERDDSVKEGQGFLPGPQKLVIR